MRLASVLASFGLLLFLIFFVPPENGLFILLFIGLVTFIIYQITKRLLFAFFTFAILMLLALGVFDIINFTLVISLLIGLAILLK